MSPSSGILLRHLLPGLGTSLAVLVVTLLGARALPWLEDASRAGEGACSETSVVHLTPDGLAGSASLCRFPGAVQTRVDLRRAAPGVMYSGWLVVFDAPGACWTSPCGVADLVDTSLPRGVGHRLGETSADRDGVARLAAEFGGMQLERGAQVSCLLLSHRPVILDDRQGPLGPSTPAWLMEGSASLAGLATRDELVAVAIFMDQ